MVCWRRISLILVWFGLDAALVSDAFLQLQLLEDGLRLKSALLGTLFPSRLEFLVPLSMSLTTGIGRWKTFQRCGIIDVLTEDGLFFGWVRMRVFSLRLCQSL